MNPKGLTAPRYKLFPIRTLPSLQIDSTEGCKTRHHAPVVCEIYESWMAPTTLAVSITWQLVTDQWRMEVVATRTFPMSRVMPRMTIDSCFRQSSRTCSLREVDATADTVVGTVWHRAWSNTLDIRALERHMHNIHFTLPVVYPSMIDISSIGNSISMGSIR